jgi:hypothetical protein
VSTSPVCRRCRTSASPSSADLLRSQCSGVADVVSISIEKRRADALRVVNAFFVALGDDHRVYEVSHGCDEEPLASAYETRLTTLKEKGLIEVVTQGPTFSLTPYGWHYYVEKYGSPELYEQFERRRFQLAATMKGFVKAWPTPR